VRPGITSLADLRGKRFATRAAGPQIWFPQVYFRQAGLLDEIEIVQVPEAETGRWGHWKRVADGDCAGCFMSRLYIDDALAAGLRELPYAPWPFEGGHVCPTVTEDVVARRGEDVQTLVTAMFEACRDTSNQPPNLLPYTQAAVDDLRSYSPLATGAEIARLNERLAAEIAPSPVPRIAGVVNALEIVTTRFPELAGHDPLIMWDLSFARAAMRKVSDATSPNLNY
jgi:ABC-type nitrate/sulfonate/bicarbonate transport system substrate-binding protein